MWRINEYMPPPPDEAPEGFNVLSIDEPLEADDFLQLAQTRSWSEPLRTKPHHVGRSIRQIGFEGISRALRRKPRAKPTTKTRQTLRALGVRDRDAWGTSLAGMFLRHGPRMAIFNANGQLDAELTGEILRIQRALRQLDEAMRGFRGSMGCNTERVYASGTTMPRLDENPPATFACTLDEYDCGDPSCMKHHAQCAGDLGECWHARPGTFGHHPDPETDVEVEKDRLEGEAYNTMFVNSKAVARGMAEPMFVSVPLDQVADLPRPSVGEVQAAITQGRKDRARAEAVRRGKTKP